MADVRPVDHGPTRFGSLLAACFAAFAVFLVTTIPGQRQPLVLVSAGVLLLVLVSVVDDHHLVALGGIAASSALLVGGLLALEAAALPISRVVELGPGLVGVVLVGLAVYPVRRGWETRLATVGALLCLTTVALAGLMENVGRMQLLVGTVAAVAAWDAARQAVSLGVQTGRGATTAPVEAVHSGGTVLAGLGTVVAATFAYDLGVGGLSIGPVLLLLLLGIGAAVTLYG